MRISETSEEATRIARNIYEAAYSDGHADALQHARMHDGRGGWFKPAEEIQKIKDAEWNRAVEKIEAMLRENASDIVIEAAGGADADLTGEIELLESTADTVRAMRRGE